MSTFACLQDEKSKLNPNEMVKQLQSRDTCSISVSKPKPLPLPPTASSSPALLVLHRRAPAAAALPSLHQNLCWVERGRRLRLWLHLPSDWKGQEENANFILVVDGIQSPHLFMGAALQCCCCAALA